MSFRLQLQAVSQQLFLHPQARIQCALRMVLVGDWRAEHGKDAVAGGLHHVAVVPIHRRDHQLKGGIDDGASVLGVEVLLQIGGSFDIGKQGSDGFALAFDRYRFRILGGCSNI